MSAFCKIEDLITESDVEQKLILAMISAPKPLGFGYLKSDFRTKEDIRKILIDKGASKKLYYPDYVVIMQGLPAVIIEAKKPGEDLEEALREARLYAHELNASFPSGVNPCKYIIVADGLNVWGSTWDSAVADVRIKFDQIYAGSEEYAKLVGIYSKESVVNYCEQIFKNIRGKRKFSRPTSILGGLRVKKEELPQNGFGSNLALEYRHLFNPVTPEDRATIVKNAYVSSKKIEKHLEPISKIILAAKPSSMSDASEIGDTTKPSEIFKKFDDKDKLKNELLILIGNVGSGKSTFVDYLKEVALPDEIKNETVWLTVDLNEAPQSKEEIYKWIRRGIVNGLREIYPEIDFDDLTTLKKIYSVEISRVARLSSQLHPGDQNKCNGEIAKKILEIHDDLEITARAYVRYFCGERSKLPVIVLDNCDRRNKEEQLLMFDVAKWIKKEYSSLVFLPIRDTTYDNHRLEPPLDTVIKDLVFRIEPPQLSAVLHRRIDYAVTDGNKKLSYTLSNGIVVTYDQPEQKVYLACILKSLFDNDPFFKQLINGLAGRDIRRGIEIFLDFCKSGHISEEEILRIRGTKGVYPLPSHLITRVLLRGNRKYYDDEASHIRNLFTSFPGEESIPDPYIRISILQWLKNRHRTFGPNQTKGYHKVSELLGLLIPIGHSEARITREIGTLVRSRCIITESQSDDEIEIISNDEVLGRQIIENDDLISIAPSGHVHLQLLSNLDYLASCAEDVWYDEIQVAQRIADRITGKEGPGYLSLLSSVNNAQDLLDYLIEYQSKLFSAPGLYLENSAYESLVGLDESVGVIENTKKRNPYLANIEKIKNSLAAGSVVEGMVIMVKPYGVFLDIGNGAVGFLHVSCFDKNQKQGRKLFQEIEDGNHLDVQIVRFNDKHSKFELKLPE